MNCIQVNQISPSELKQLLHEVIRAELQGINRAPPIEVKEILSLKEAADLLGISKQTLTNHTKKGLIKARRFGGLKKYRRSEIEKFIAGIPEIKVSV